METWPFMQQGHLVPLSFNDVEKEDYISAVIVSYEYNCFGPLTDLYVWAYRRSCQLFDVTAESMGIDTLRIQYRAQRRKMIRRIIVDRINLKEALAWIQRHDQDIPKKHKTKFRQDVISELSNLEWFKVNGLGVSRDLFNQWKKLI